jgi:hypothetical protein
MNDFSVRGVIWNTTKGGLQMRFVTKVAATVVLVTALLQAPGDSLEQVNCGFLTIEQ